MIKETVGLYYLNVAIIFILLLLSFMPLYDGRSSKPFARGAGNNLYFSVNLSLLLLYLVFQFTEYDYWNYWENFIYKNDMVEPLQGWIRDQFSDFYTWRLAVWGGALCIFLIGFRRLGLNSRVFFPLFILGYLSRFISREQLGLAIMFLGSTFFLTPLKYKTLSYIIGALLVAGSYYFHNSMIISIAMLVPAFVRVDSKKAILVLLMFVPLMFLFTYLMSDATFMNMFYDTSTNTGNRIDIYSEQVTNALNLNGLLRQLLYWSPIIIMLYDIIRRSSKKRKEEKLPQAISYYLNYWFYMFVISFVFSFISSSAFVSVRFLDKSLFAMIVVLSYWFSVQMPNKLMRASLWLFLLYNCFNYFLIIYKAS